VLGLADEVAGHVRGVGGVVGEDRHLRRAGLRVDADVSLEQSLGGRDVDVAGAGDHGRGLAASAVGEVGAEREQRHGLGPAGRVDLVHPEQRAGRQDRGVRQAAVVALGRARDGERRHAGHLRGHDVHHDAAGVDRAATGHVEAHPLHRQEPVTVPGTTVVLMSARRWSRTARARSIATRGPCARLGRARPGRVEACWGTRRFAGARPSRARPPAAGMDVVDDLAHISVAASTRGPRGAGGRGDQLSCPAGRCDGSPGKSRSRDADDRARGAPGCRAA
jgi:hypothetical protein